MEYKEAYDLIHSTYVLTEKEKNVFLSKFKKGDPMISNILMDFKSNGNVQAFYNQLRAKNLLSTQNTFNEFMNLYTPKRSNKNHSKSTLSGNSPLLSQAPPAAQFSKSPLSASPLFKDGSIQMDNSYHQNSVNSSAESRLTALLSVIPIHTVRLNKVLSSFCGNFNS